METPPTCCCHEFWTTHHPECPTLRPSSKTPTDTEVEEALNEESILTDMGYFVGGDPMKMFRTGEDDYAIQARDSLLRRFDTLRAALAAKDDEIASLKYQKELLNDGWVAERDRVRAAAENRGFRAAADWLAENENWDGRRPIIRYGPQEDVSPARALHAKADRREGKV